MNTTLFKQLLAYRAPHPRHAHEYEGRVGDVDSVGIAHRLEPSERTKNGSFSRAIVESDFGHLIVWWSYVTPIAIQHMLSGYALKSTYSYSPTTNRHQGAIRLLNDMPDAVLTFYGHVGNGIKPAEVIDQRKGWVHQHKLSLSRARQRRDWAAARLVQRLHHLEDACTKLGETVVLPEFGEGLSDKAHAKLLGLGLNDEEIADTITLYHEVKERLHG